MRAVIQRVKKASVSINSKIFSKIDNGLLIFLGIENTDNEDDIKWLSEKISKMRIFPDEKNVMNLSVKDVKGEILLISQFTLHASTKKGNRPSYIRSANVKIAFPIYEKFIKKLSFCLGKEIKTGIFGKNMQVNLINDGPVTILIDTKDKE